MMSAFTMVCGECPLGEIALQHHSRLASMRAFTAPGNSAASRKTARTHTMGWRNPIMEGSLYKDAFPIEVRDLLPLKKMQSPNKTMRFGRQINNRPDTILVLLTADQR